MVVANKEATEQVVLCG